MMQAATSSLTLTLPASNYSLYTLEELCTLALSYCHRLEVWGLDSVARQEFDSMLAELAERNSL